MSIQFVDLKAQYRGIKDQIDSRISRVLEHGQYIMGPEVFELEEKLTDYSGAKHCISVSSGTDALLISLMALGIGPGDEVITTPFSFAATVEVILLVGAKPVFVDIQSSTCNIDANKIEAKITNHTKAIIPVSLYGQPADMDEINNISKRYGNIPVIEDAAQSFGASYRGQRSCNLSKIGCTSFFPSKPLGCYGDGGAIFTSDDGFAEICKQIRVHGQSERYLHTRLGIGGRMDTLQCAIVLAKLDHFDWEIERRKDIGSRYDLFMDELGIVRIKQLPDRTSVYAQYTVRLPNRDRIQKKLSEAGIPTSVHYPKPLNSQPAYLHLCCSSCTPIANEVASDVISLPMGAHLDEETQSTIVSALADEFA